MSYTRKFTLLWLMSLVAIAVVVYSLFVSLDKVIQPSQRQLQGLALIEPISRTVQFIQQHRGISAALLGGNETMRDRHAAKEREAAEAFKAMEGVLPPGLTSNEDFRRIRADWEQLRKEGLHWAVAEDFNAHTRLIEQIQLFELSVADDYALTLDPELATFYLIDTTVNKLPHVLEHLGQLRAYGTGILAKKRITEPQKDKLNAQSAELDSTLRELRINIEKTGRYNPTVQKSFLGVSDGIAGSARQITGLVSSDILTGHFATPPDVFLDMATVAIDNCYTQMYESLLPTAETLIKARIAKAKNALYTSTGISLLVFLLVIYLSVSIYYAIIGNIQSLVRSAHTFADGDLRVRVQLNTRDELSQVGDSFNKMADGFIAMLEARREDEARLRATIETAMDVEDELKKTKERYDFATMIGKVGTWDWSPITGALVWSDETYRLMGFEPRSITPTYEIYLGLVHPGDRERLNSGVQAALNEKKPYALDCRIVLGSGKEIVCHVTGKVEFDANDQPIRMLGTIQDITERHLVIEQLRNTTIALEQAKALIEEERAQLAKRVTERTDQLLYANKAKDSFLATMSHEIRTPLGGLLGMMEMLSLSRLDDEQREMLQAARDSGESLLRIVDDILDWSKIEAGKLELAPQAATIPEIINGVVSTYSSLASAKGLLLWQQVDSKLGAEHIFDPLRLSQILNNFTSNAIKFTEQGTVEISAELIAQHEGAEQVCFCVKDSGVGIDKEQQVRLFQHYEQASADTARMYGGTGLGLAICRSLAELMEGTISVESTPGVGSTFCFMLSLPVARPAAQSDLQLRQAREDSRDENKPDLTPLVKDGKLLSVLVVDDHPINRKLLKQQLELLGVHAEVATNGIVALSLWGTVHFDLVITDCHMPEMDGYELTRSIREIEQHDGRQRVPVIAWTANVLAEEEGRCRAAGMDDMLTKPTELADLRAMLLKWLAKADIPSVEAPPTGNTSIVAAQNKSLADTPIDFSVLKMIVTSHAAQVEMLQEFNLHNRSDIAGLKEALKDGDPAAVERIAHRIKGASRIVGAMELDRICTAIEKAAAQGDLSGAQLVADTALDETIERIEAAINAFIAVQ